VAADAIGNVFTLGKQQLGFESTPSRGSAPGPTTSLPGAG